MLHLSIAPLKYYVDNIHSLVFQLIFMQLKVQKCVHEYMSIIFKIFNNCIKVRRKKITFPDMINFKKNIFYLVNK